MSDDSPRDRLCAAILGADEDTIRYICCPCSHYGCTHDDWKLIAMDFACARGHEDAVSLLLRRGASLETPCWNGYTPLCTSSYAVGSGTLEHLLAHGAIVDDIPIHTFSAPYSATTFGNVRSVRALLERGASRWADCDTQITNVNHAASMAVMYCTDDRKRVLEMLVGDL